MERRRTRFPVLRVLTRSEILQFESRHNVGRVRAAALRRADCRCAAGGDRRHARETGYERGHPGNPGGWIRRICVGGDKWQRRVFVTSRRLGTSFMTKIEEVHRLTRNVPVDRGYVYMHSVDVSQCDLPPTVDRNLLLACHKDELARRDRLKTDMQSRRKRS